MSALGVADGAERVRASVVVCTRNRVALLAGCLSSLSQQSQTALQVVVVDSASSDGTADFLARWVEGQADRRWISLERPGLSYARNVGLQQAQEDVVLFLDDDARATPGWVDAHMAAHLRPELAGRGDDVVAAVGGPIRLRFPEGRPGWLAAELEHWWSALDHGPGLRPFPEGCWPYGANMSVHRELALAVGGFSERLGRAGTGLRSNEEADLVLRMYERGAVLWQSEAGVDHLITSERLHRRWLLRRAWAQGPSNVAMEAGLGLVPPGGPRQAAREQAALALRGSPGVGRPRSASQALDQVSRRTCHLSAALCWTDAWLRPTLGGRPAAADGDAAR